MSISRDMYLEKVVAAKNDGSVKVITGIRRCGKSYLLFNLFKEHLLSAGVNAQDGIDYSKLAFGGKFPHVRDSVLRPASDSVLRARSQ